MKYSSINIKEKDFLDIIARIANAFIIKICNYI